MSFTQTQLDALDAAIASGTLEVRYDGKEIKYRTLAELRQARQIVASALAEAAGTKRPGYVNPAFSRGT